MGNARGVRRDFVALEKRRFEAVKLFEKDLNNSEIGRRLKASNQTVSRWRKEYQETARLLCGGRGERDGNPVWMKSTKPVWSSCSCKVPSAWVTKLPCGRVHGLRT